MNISLYSLIRVEILKKERCWLSITEFIPFVGKSFYQTELLQLNEDSAVVQFHIIYLGEFNCQRA